MLYLLLVVIPLVAIATWSVLRERRAMRGRDVVRHTWAGAHASSTDGVRVRIEGEVTYRVTGSCEKSADGLVREAAAEALRQSIVTGRVLTLPGVGDEVAVARPEGLDDIHVERLLVTAADVEITRELRRLVGGP